MTKSQMFESLLREEYYEYGADTNDPHVKELVELRIEDLNRKGCIPETYPGNECHGCGSCVDGQCPLEDWEKRHPEFVNDELSQKIKALETELYGWHELKIWKNEYITGKTVKEFIENLKKYPEDSPIENGVLTIRII